MKVLLTVKTELSRLIRLIAWTFLLVLATGCSLDSKKRHYLLAERLWSEKNYGAAVKEFDQVTARDPKGSLGLQALYRSAMTETLFLNEHLRAAKKFETYVRFAGDTATEWSAQKEIGEIWFSKLRLYDRAITHYETLLKKDPSTEEAPLFKFRIAKSLYFQKEFGAAYSRFIEIQKEYPKTKWGETALLEAGYSLFTGADLDYNAKLFDRAIQVFQKFIETYPKSEEITQAKFGIASCWSEMDHIDQAIEEFEKIKASYPTPKVIEIKIARLKERKLTRGRVSR